MRDARIFWLPVMFVALALVAAACDDAPAHDFGGYEPYPITQETNGTDPSDASVSDAHANASDASSSGSAHKDASSGALADANASDDAADADQADAGPAPSAFTDASAFTPDAGPSTLQPQHNFAGNNPTTNPAKQACLNCHASGGAGVAFVYAGTVFTDATGTTPAAGVEVRVRTDNGTDAIVYTDANGNFFDRTEAITFGAAAGVRTAAATQLMVNEAANGNCNSCHNGTAQAYIHVP
jgi:hypothetical protein